MKRKIIYPILLTLIFNLLIAGSVENSNAPKLEISEALSIAEKKLKEENLHTEFYIDSFYYTRSKEGTAFWRAKYHTEIMNPKTEEEYVLYHYIDVSLDGTAKLNSQERRNSSSRQRIIIPKNKTD